tara:strand:+ start:201 stop:455 length:255 start_codon:yes stop_codon:yes gene_type:complete
MRKIINKQIRFCINFLFALIWFVFCINIWDSIDAWLEYKKSYYEYFWINRYYFLIPLPITFLLIFASPYYFISKYIWFNPNKRR